jgi:SAM-dependent methyltransferase
MARGSRIEPFVRSHGRYDDWFERHRAAYLSELLAVRALLPWQGRGLEIGVGTGRFAGPLGVPFGIDPAREMLGYARRRRVTVVRSVAEALPFRAATFDYALIVTTICFVDDPRATLHEVARVLRPDGELVLGLIDRESTLGQAYVAHRAENVFYREARFFSASEVDALLAETGFRDTRWIQTLHVPLSQVQEILPARRGTGEGAFLVAHARGGREAAP